MIDGMDGTDILGYSPPKPIHKQVLLDGLDGVSIVEIMNIPDSKQSRLWGKERIEDDGEEE